MVKKKTGKNPEENLGVDDTFGITGTVEEEEEKSTQPEDRAGSEEVIPPEGEETPSQETTEPEDPKEEEPTVIDAKPLEEFAEKKGFKSADDLVKSYEEMESKSTRTSQDNAEIRKIVEPYVEFDEKGKPIKFKQGAPSVGQQQPTAGAESGKSANEIFADMWEENPLGAISSLVNIHMNERLKPIEDERSETKLANTIETVAERLGAEKEFQMLSADIAGELDKMDTNLKKQFPEQAVETAYYRVLKTKGGERSHDTNPPHVEQPGGGGGLKRPMTEEDEIKEGLVKEGQSKGLLFG